MDAIPLRLPRAVPAVLVAGGIAVGGLLGWFGPALAGGIATLIERTPLRAHGMVHVIADLDHASSMPTLGAAGLLGGIALAIAAIIEAPAMDVSRSHLEHRQKNAEVWVERGDVGAAFRDGRDLVLLRPGGGLRVRLDVNDLPAENVRHALTTTGWPLRDDDPFDRDFLPWADGRPGFTPEETVLLRRRRQVGKDADARRAIDEELAQVGLVARMRKDRLQVRHVRGARRGAHR